VPSPWNRFALRFRQPDLDYGPVCFGIGELEAYELLRWILVQARVIAAKNFLTATRGQGYNLFPIAEKAFTQPHRVVGGTL
jgi:hypothetical protein